MGKVMTAVMPKVKGKTDGSLVNKLVIQLLA
ncbi:GatB/YqeY domain-containing protein, partial [Bacillus cereus]